MDGAPRGMPPLTARARAGGYRAMPQFPPFGGLPVPRAVQRTLTDARVAFAAAMSAGLVLLPFPDRLPRVLDP
jgi:hypothetical protein